MLGPAGEGSGRPSYLAPAGLPPGCRWQTPTRWPRPADHRVGSVAPAGAPGTQRPAACLAIADLRLAAWFLWITPLLTALSSLRPA